MGLEDAIEQLSFGRTLPKIDVCLGLYLSPEVLFLAEVKLSGGKPQILHLVRLPIPGMDASTKSKTRTVGTLNTEFLNDQEKLLGVLKKALTEIRWKSRHVVVTLSHHFGILRYFAMPAIDRRFWKTAVPAEAKKYVPIPFGSLAFDYRVRPIQAGPDGKPRLGALFGVTHVKNINNLRAVVEKAGLALLGTELAPCSVERLWDTIAGSTEPYAHVHFDAGHIRILISEEGMPIFFREVFLPSDASVLDRRKVDLAGCIEFTRKQIGLAGPQRIRLSGQIGDLPAWKDAFSQDLGRQVEIQETDKALGLRGGQWGGYAAIGSALRLLADTPLTLDLSSVSKITEEDKRAATAILAISVAVAAFFLLLGGYRYAMLEYKTRMLRSMRSDAEVYEAFQGKSALDVEMEIGRMRDKVNSFGAIAAPQVPLTSIMETLAEDIPRTAWLDGIVYENPLATSGTRHQPRKLKLDGRVADASSAIEQDTLYKFSDKLVGDPRFKKAFPGGCTPDVKRQETDADGGSKMSSYEKLDEREKNASQYTIRCASARES